MEILYLHPARWLRPAAMKQSPACFLLNLAKTFTITAQTMMTRKENFGEKINIKLGLIRLGY
jgi:hypothetical protein